MTRNGRRSTSGNHRGTRSGIGWWPYLLVLAGAAIGLGAVALDFPPWAGGVVIGVALIAGAVFRLVAADERAGLLRLRSRRMDALALAGLGMLLVLGSLSLLLRLHTT